MDIVEWQETYFEDLIDDFCVKYEVKKNCEDSDEFLESLSTEDYEKWEIFLEKEYIDFLMSVEDYYIEAWEKRHYGWP